jgi:hypothetical protein
MAERDYRENYAPYRKNVSRPGLNAKAIDRTKNLFVMVCILCGTAIVLAVTTKVIMSLFT